MQYQESEGKNIIITRVFPEHVFNLFHFLAIWMGKEMIVTTRSDMVEYDIP